MSQETALLDQGSGAPTGFANESPFKKKARKKDPVASALMAAGIGGIVLCLAAVLMASMSM